MESEYVIDYRTKKNPQSSPGDIYFTKSKSPSPLQSVTVELSKEGEYSLASNDLQSDNERYVNWDEKPSKNKTIVTENYIGKEKRDAKTQVSLTLSKKWIFVIIISIISVIIIIGVALKMSLKRNESILVDRDSIE